jgi:response regulator RpfG family c-di-GMP phosphodiesterase
MRMPEMDGLTLLKEVKGKYPMTVRIVLSGYTQLQQILATINQVDIFKFITKPWKLEEEFKVVIDRALEYYRLLIEREGLKKSMESKNLAYQKILQRIDEVIASAKNDVQIARGAGIQTVDYIGRLIESGKPLDAIKEEVKSIGRAFRGIMNAVAPESSDTELNEILEKYVSLLKSR